MYAGSIVNGVPPWAPPVRKSSVSKSVGLSLSKFVRVTVRWAVSTGAELRHPGDDTPGITGWVGGNSRPAGTPS